MTSAPNPAPQAAVQAVSLSAPEADYVPPRNLLQVLGPGLITGAADDDPSGIATYSQVGAQFGYHLGWVMLFSYPLMGVIQQVSAEIGSVTGAGIARNLRRHYPRWVLRCVVSILLVANIANLGADLGAMAQALVLLTGGPVAAFTVGFGVLCVVLEVFLNYRRYADLLKWLTVSLFAYVAVVFAVHVPWHEALRDTFLPTLSFDTDHAEALVAVLGTTISPYLFFWQAAEEVEEQLRRTVKPLYVAPAEAGPELRRIRTDTWVGMGYSNLISLFIIFAVAATLHVQGITNIQTSSQAAEALRPIAGAVRVCGVCRRHHRHRAAGGAGAGRFRGLCGLRGVRLGGGPRPQAARCPRLLRHDRRRDAGRRGAELHRYRSDQGALLERGAERSARRAADGDHAASSLAILRSWGSSCCRGRCG